MGHLGNLRNEYQDLLGADFDKTPKSVYAALAVSLAMRLNPESNADALKMLRDEWATLHANGIVPQKPPKETA